MAQIICASRRAGSSPLHMQLQLRFISVCLLYLDINLQVNDYDVQDYRGHVLVVYFN